MSGSGSAQPLRKSGYGAYLAALLEQAGQDSRDF